MVVVMAKTTLLQPVFFVTKPAIEGRWLQFQVDIEQISETASRKESGTQRNCIYPRHLEGSNPVQPRAFIIS
jgi:hypothetical protein